LGWRGEGGYNPRDPQGIKQSWQHDSKWARSQMATISFGCNFFSPPNVFHHLSILSATKLNIILPIYFFVSPQHFKLPH
jgi:hypothetical protein